MDSRKISSLVNALRTIKHIIKNQNASVLKTTNLYINHEENNFLHQQEMIAKFFEGLSYLMRKLPPHDDIISYFDDLLSKMRTLSEKGNEFSKKLREEAIEIRLQAQEIKEKWEEFDYILDEIDDN